MTHRELSEMYELYALGLLDANEKDEIDQHLAQGCTECGKGVRQAVEISTMFALLPEPVAPPKRLRRRILAAVGAASPPSRSNLVWAIAGASLALVALIAAILITNGVTNDLRTSREQLEATRRSLRSSNAQLSTLRELLQFLNEPSTVEATFGGGQTLPPRGRVFVNANRGVLLIASHLPPAPSGKTYEMWVVPKGGAPRPAGLFQSDAQGDAFHLQSGSIDRSRTAAIAVSLEPDSGSPQPTTTPLIVAALSE